MIIKDAIETIREIVESGENPMVNVFGEDHYIPSIEVLDAQVFNPIGYKIVIMKIEDKEVTDV